MTKLTELLAPAKNLECGIAAINHGADAIYIGASQFGARAAAGNSVEDIASLVQYAHRYKAKVLVALNTILTDEQLPEAEKLIHRIYHAGADALIVQDMGILKMDIPPIALHASTQTNNRTPEKVQFLQDAGFSRVVLARELTLQQIQTISSQTSVELEAFVHGALCVSYSGQCYMSQALCGRSANRGQCAQYCRLPYQLYDADGNQLLKNKHLLSLKDLDLSDSLEEMMKAGISSFKIEGRLKDIDYVKNITAYYRGKLDAILEGNKSYGRASSGRTLFNFTPNPEKSFRRGASDYFLHGRKPGLVQLQTPKSMGELIGKVKNVGAGYFSVVGAEKLNNGDGLCFINAQGDLSGFRANRVEGQRVFPAEMPKITAGVDLYRNQDQEFDRVLQRKTSERRIAVDILMKETTDGFEIVLTDEDGWVVKNAFVAEKQPAQKPDAVNDNVRNQLSKLGNTIYQAREIKIETSGAWFFPSSQLGEWRRQSFEKLDEYRLNAYKREERKIAKQVPLYENTLDYTANITNSLSDAFYKEHGVQSIMPGFEVKAQDDVPLMYCKYCVKFQMGWCPKEGYKAKISEPLLLENNGQRFELRFDCKKCEMHIYKAK